jgi:hypothetical protein
MPHPGGESGIRTHDTLWRARRARQENYVDASVAVIVTRAAVRLVFYWLTAAARLEFNAPARANESGVSQPATLKTSILNSRTGQDERVSREVPDLQEP